MQRRQGRPALLQAMIDAFSLPDLRQRIVFTLGILIIFRFIAHIPLSVVANDLDGLKNLFEQTDGTGGLLSMLDLFSGGGMKNFSLVAMGVYPYITASIIMQLLVPVIPRLQAIAQEGEYGQNKINRYTHWLMVPIAALQGYGQYMLIKSTNAVDIGEPGTLTLITMIVSLVAGTVFLVWLGELITERGIGNGISMIIFAGIVAGFPEMLGRGNLEWSQNAGGVIGFILLSLATLVLIVVFTEAHRRIPVHYSRSVFRGRRMYRQSGSTHIPLRVNTAGMIPLIFSMSVVIMPAVIASWFQGNSVADFFTNDWTSHWGYWLTYFVLTIGFAFFYTTVIFEQMNLAGTLQKQGGFIPGIRPGRTTSQYLSRVMNRITWGGALFLAFVAIMPYIAELSTNVKTLALSSTAMLIMVGVALDTMKQLESQLVMRRYEGFLK